MAVRAFVTFLGAQGGRQSIRRPIEVLDLADGTHRFRLNLTDVPARAKVAEVEIELPDEVAVNDLFQRISSPPVSTGTSPAMAGVRRIS